MTDEEKREKRRALARSRYAKNPDIVKARVLRYTKKYPERKKAFNKKYYAVYGCKRRSEVSVETRMRYEETKKAWYFKNHEKHLRKCRDYYAANKEKVLKQAQHRRLTKVFDGVLDASTQELLVVTKMVQLNIKKLLQHGEANEKRN